MQEERIIDNDQIQERSWEEFRSTGLFLLINQLLHAFGWVLVSETDEKTNKVLRMYPAKASFRGFPEKAQIHAYGMIDKYLKEDYEGSRTVGDVKIKNPREEVSLVQVDEFTAGSERVLVHTLEGPKYISVIPAPMKKRK